MVPPINVIKQSVHSETLRFPKIEFLLSILNRRNAMALIVSKAIIKKVVMLLVCNLKTKLINLKKI